MNQEEIKKQGEIPENEIPEAEKLLPQFQEVDKRFVELEGEEGRPEWENVEFIPEPEEVIPVEEKAKMIPLIPRATPEEVMMLGEYQPPEFAAFDYWAKYGLL